MVETRAKVGICCGSLAILLLLILLPMSFSRLSYYEIGLKRSRISGTIERDTTYESGNHLLGPDGLFLIYPADNQIMDLPDQSVWSKASDTDAGTLLAIDVSFQYQIVPEKLGDLYDKVGINYEPLIRNLAITAIKNTAVKHSADDYLTDRRNIETEMFEAVKTSLENQADSELILLQMNDVTFPDLFYQRKLDAATQIKKNEAEEFKRESRIVRGETLQLVNYIENDAKLTVDISKAKSENIKKTAENTADQIIQNVRNNGLMLIEDELNVTDHKHLLSLDYLVELELKEKTDFLVNFENTAKTVSP